MSVHRVSGSPASPSAILGSALAAWWSADDHGGANMTDDGAGLISSWKDRVAALDCTGATTARPTWTAAGFNGRAGVTGDGVANALTVTSTTGLPTAADPGVVFAVFSTTLVDATARFPINYGGTATSRGMRQNNATGLLVTCDAGAVGPSVAFTAAGSFIVLSIATGALLQGRINGSAAGSSAVVPNSGTNRLRLFSNSNGAGAAGFLGGTIRQAGVITGVPTQAQILALEGWFALDGGLQSRLPGNHPYRVQRP